MSDIKLSAGRTLSQGEEKVIDATIKEMQDVRDEVEVMQGVSYEAKNKPALNKKIEALQKLKEEKGIPELSGSELERARAELKILQDSLRQDMPTWTEYAYMSPKDGPRYNALVQKIVKWENDAVRRSKIQRWKTLRRLCDRENSQAANIMYLFPH